MPDQPKIITYASKSGEVIIANDRGLDVLNQREENGSTFWEGYSYSWDTVIDILNESSTPVTE